ncbi:hypothetical protein ACFQZC_14665 [Streptacidiphilus monticola]
MTSAAVRMADDALRSSIREALGEVETGTASGRPRAQLPSTRPR